MRSETDEMNLTAYALGELEGAEREAVESRLAGSDEDRRLVEEVRLAARMVSEELSREADNGLDAIHYAAIELRLRDSAWPWPTGRRDVVAGRIGFGLSLAASVAIIGGLVGVLLLIVSRPTRVAVSGPRAQPHAGPILVPLENTMSEVGAPGRGMPVAPGTPDPFVSVDDHPVSSFAMNTDTEAYDEVRQAIYSNRRPTRDSLKIEGLINAFSYDDPAPAPGATFGGTIEIGQCPWQPEHRLARIAVKARSGTGTVAQDVHTEVEFASARVKSYRLLGYDLGASDRSKNGESVSAGHLVTALYELVPTASVAAPGEVLNLRVRYRTSEDGPEQDVRIVGRDPVVESSMESRDFRFCAAVAEFGLLLRGSLGYGHITSDQVIELANSGRGTDLAGEREQFIELVHRARQWTG